MGAMMVPSNVIIAPIQKSGESKRATIVTPLLGFVLSAIESLH